MGLSWMMVTALSDPGQLRSAERKYAGGDAGSDHPTRAAARNRG
jgi:hypothetical protein